MLFNNFFRKVPLKFEYFVKKIAKTCFESKIMYKFAFANIVLWRRVPQ